MAIGEHHNPKSQKDEWLTPPELIKALGRFDLDPCSPEIRPWNTAGVHLTKADDGLNHAWSGRSFMNPPYSNISRWMHKMSLHNHGTALTFARTETKWFSKYVWNKATAVLFIEGRLKFYHVSGVKAKNNSGGPSCLIAYSLEDAIHLSNCPINGKLILL